MADAVAAHAATRIALDTYHREVERYAPLLGPDFDAATGSDPFSAIEQLFCADSFGVAQVIHALRKRGATIETQERQAIAARLVDDLFSSLSLHGEEKMNTLDFLAGDSGSAKKKDGDIFRQNKLFIEGFGAPNDGMVAEALSQRKQRLNHAARFKMTFDTRAVGALAHMTLNRFLSREQQKKESDTYRLLRLVYRSRSARHK